MADVDIYKAVRNIMRARPGGIGLDLSRLNSLAHNPDFQSAVDCVAQAIESPVVEVSVVAGGKRRKIEKYERSYRFDFWAGTLTDPFVDSSQPPLRNLLIAEEGLQRLAAPPAIAKQIEEKDIEPQRFPGRPTARRQIVAKMRERFAAGEADKSLAAEARWLMRWAQKEYPNDTSVPRTSKGMENSLRDEFNRLKGERAASE